MPKRKSISAISEIKIKEGIFILINLSFLYRLDLLFFKSREKMYYTFSRPMTLNDVQVVALINFYN